MSEMSELKSSATEWLQSKMQLGYELEPTVICMLLSSFDLMEKMAAVDRVGPYAVLEHDDTCEVEKQDTQAAAGSVLLLLLTYLTGAKDQQRVKLQFEAERFLAGYAHRIQSRKDRSPDVL